ncbi:MAG: hypothetical protein AABX16_04340 [Nanoarchaeota archaeon]
MSKYYIPFPRPDLSQKDLELLIRDYQESFNTVQHIGVKKFDGQRLLLLYEALETHYGVTVSPDLIDHVKSFL